MASASAQQVHSKAQSASSKTHLVTLESWKVVSSYRSDFLHLF